MVDTVSNSILQLTFQKCLPVEFCLIFRKKIHSHMTRVIKHFSIPSYMSLRSIFFIHLNQNNGLHGRNEGPATFNPQARD